MMDCFQKVCGIKSIARTAWHLVFSCSLQFGEETKVSLIYLRKFSQVHLSSFVIDKYRFLSFPTSFYIGCSPILNEVGSGFGVERSCHFSDFGDFGMSRN